jgi:hypothetical protein
MRDLETLLSPAQCRPHGRSASVDAAALPPAAEDGEGSANEEEREDGEGAEEEAAAAALAVWESDKSQDSDKDAEEPKLGAEASANEATNVRDSRELDAAPLGDVAAAAAQVIICSNL